MLSLLPLLPLSLAPRRAKYELKHVVRTHLAANDAAFNCVVEQEDKEAIRGVKLSKELMAIAGVLWCAYRRYDSIGVVGNILS